VPADWTVAGGAGLAQKKGRLRFRFVIPPRPRNPIRCRHRVRVRVIRVEFHSNDGIPANARREISTGLRSQVFQPAADTAYLDDLANEIAEVAVQRAPAIRPASWSVTALLFGVPALSLSLSLSLSLALAFAFLFHWLGPNLRQGGTTWWRIFHLLLILPLTCMLVAALIGAAVEGRHCMTAGPSCARKWRCRPRSLQEKLCNCTDVFLKMIPSRHMPIRKDLEANLFGDAMGLPDSPYGPRLLDSV